MIQAIDNFLNSPQELLGEIIFWYAPTAWLVGNVIWDFLQWRKDKKIFEDFLKK